MPSQNLNHRQRVHRVCHMIDNAVKVTLDDWTEVESERTVRSIVRQAGWCLDALINGNPPKADQHYAVIRRAVEQLPNGDTTPGAR